MIHDVVVVDHLLQVKLARLCWTFSELGCRLNSKSKIRSCRRKLFGWAERSRGSAKLHLNYAFKLTYRVPYKELKNRHYLTFESFFHKLM
jgi:hypothetical protein